MNTVSKGAQNKLIHSKSFSHPSSYVKAIYNKYSSWVFDEEDCLQFKGQWRESVFKSHLSAKLNLEIGPGSGGFFEHKVVNNKDCLFIAVELKYKPLIQTTRRIKKGRCQNARTIRYNARMLDDIFAPEEINNVYIHFPDPWPKKRHHKHRLIKSDFVKKLYQIQRKSSFVEIKTDHRVYFDEIQSAFKESPYWEYKFCHDLHNNVCLNEHNFITNFEKIFLRKKQPVCYSKYKK